MANSNNNSTPPNDDVDYSPSATVILFPRPLPPLRSPLPSSSSFVLAFSSPSSFSSAFRSSRLSLLSQCHSAARFACALSASHACRPPFWSSLLRPGFAHREQCEEREAAACFRVAKERCVGFAEEKCVRGFRDARVGLRKVDWREAARVGIYASGRDFGLGFVGMKRLGSWDEVRDRCLVTTCRGSDLIGADFGGFRT